MSEDSDVNVDLSGFVWVALIICMFFSCQYDRDRTYNFELEKLKCEEEK